MDTRNRRWLRVGGLGRALTLSLMVMLGAAPFTPIQLGTAAAAVDAPDEDEQSDPVLVQEQTTETSTTWRMPDGSMSTDVYASPRNFESNPGEWTAINNTLVDSDVPGVAVSNAANDYEMRLPEDASERPVSFSADGRWINFRMHGLDGSPSVDGSEATYSQAEGAVSVVYEAAAEGLKESIILGAAPSSPVSYAFDVSLSSGLRPALAASGEVRVHDSTGKLAFVLPAPFMFDSDSPEPAFSSAVTYGLSPASDGQGWVLTVTPDQDWLSDPDRVYPITVDPTVSEQPPVTDCWISEAAQTDNKCGSAEYIRVGMADGLLRRGLLKFGLSAVPANATVELANLHLYMDASESTTSQMSEYVARRVTSPWTASATWRNRTATSSWSSYGGDIASAARPGTLLSGENSGDKVLDVTAITQGWIDGAAPNYGFAVKQRYENDNNMIAFYSEAYSNSARWPKLNVRYSIPPTPPLAPTQLSFSPGEDGIVTTVTPLLAAVINPQSTSSLRVRFDVSLGSQSVWTSSSALTPPGGTATVQMPPGILQYEQTYSVKATTLSAANVESATSTLDYVSPAMVDTTTPQNAPVVDNEPLPEDESAETGYDDVWDKAWGADPATLEPSAIPWGLGFFISDGDRVRVKDLGVLREAHGHGWWLKYTSNANLARVTVRLQIQLSGTGQWVTRSTGVARIIRPGTARRAIAKSQCHRSQRTLWRSAIDVDLVGVRDDPRWAITAPQYLTCR